MPFLYISFILPGCGLSGRMVPSHHLIKVPSILWPHELPDPGQLTWSHELMPNGPLLVLGSTNKPSHPSVSTGLPEPSVRNCGGSNETIPPEPYSFCIFRNR